MNPRIIPFFPKWWPWIAMAFINVILIKKGAALKTEQLQHEKIHLKQQRDLWYLPFFIIYILEFLLRLVCNLNWMQAYQRISFEQEANHLETITWEELESYRFEWFWLQFLRNDIIKYLRTEWWPYAAVVLLSGYIYIDQRLRNQPPRIDSFAISSLSDYPKRVHQDTVMLKDLIAAYKENGIKADRTYKDKRIFTIGRITEISNTMANRGLLKLYWDDQSMAYAYFDGPNIEPLTWLKIYTVVGITCNCSGMLVNRVHLTDCELKATYKE